MVKVLGVEERSHLLDVASRLLLQFPAHLARDDDRQGHADDDFDDVLFPRTDRRETEVAFKLLEKDLHGPPGPVKISDLLGRDLVRRQMGDVEMIFAGLLVFDADETKGTEDRAFLDLPHLLVRDVTGSKKSFGVEDLAAQVGFHFPETPVTEVDAVSRPFPQVPKQKGIAVRLQATDEKASAIVDFPEALDLERTQVEKKQVPFHPRLRRQEGAFGRLAREVRKRPRERD